ncbi:F0F1 ATP synthase subunit alpha [Candidatus Kaiserbacteria bacterium RIFCSPHIGHO2_01_FULL_48_10]|uniref:ATP synthase subunit alpha n=1 Tax=Candidatus Kaiserbacteria bacterium RIFCSPHIGHO2_01_FULL_48_10 TaxID=1798476 RepID=A0A1F6C5X3_9BACT|nr:MAG: F0F1 ATP synthase subunit alpha [Candidatus Kaiserbacteria bacterium RIFCSPHIGHO2_01_FULL_48_10]
MKSSSLRIREIGTVTAVYDEILRIEGFPSVSEGEILESPGNGRAFVLGFDHDRAYAAVLGEWKSFGSGTTLVRTKQLFQVPAGEQFLGRVVNIFGKPLDEKGDIDPTAFLPVEREAPSIIVRESVHEPLSTGILSIDATIPLGRGQRELIIGDRKTGKTTVALETIINQRQSWWEAGGLNGSSGGKSADRPVVCIYVSIGQKKSDIARVVKTLEEHHALEYTTVVVASSSDSATENYLAPYAGTSMAEYFRDKGYDALVVYDDLTKHAWAYRNLSLLLGRPPGREAYPGDVFYIHAKLLERSAKMNAENGGGSLTALPIMETVEGDITGYISTNLISITDGQIYLSPELFRKGNRPAVNIGLSVSRVGSAAQIPAIKKLTARLKLDLAQAAELKRVAEVSPQSLSKESRAVLEKGERILSVLKQKEHHLYRLSEQACVWSVLFSGKIEDVPSDHLPQFFDAFIDFIRQTDTRLLGDIDSKPWGADLENKILEHLAKFRQMHTL